MDLFEAIKKRYSYRGEFTGEKISRESLKKIVQAGLDAPSGKNLQTTRFIIIDDQEILGSIKNILPDKSTIRTCNAIVVCIIDKNPNDVYHGYQFQLEDCAAAVENMLLAITALGYATVWLDGVLRVEAKSEKISTLLKLPDTKKVQIILPIGVPVSEASRKEKMLFEERVWFNGYNHD